MTEKTYYYNETKNTLEPETLPEPNDFQKITIDKITETLSCDVNHLKIKTKRQVGKTTVPFILSRMFPNLSILVVGDSSTAGLIQVIRDKSKSAVTVKSTTEVSKRGQERKKYDVCFLDEMTEIPPPDTSAKLFVSLYTPTTQRIY